uniref:Uncharacterized protein n=1 Tax=Theileria parva TaxID=5875 RepID=Q4N2C2_THEPA|eukprot:XP_764064.1 hypothetical protein [Theileria parva strain Muguga]
MDSCLIFLKGKFIILITILFTFLPLLGEKNFVYSFQTRDSTPDGNIPTVDVQMIPQKRWLSSSREFQNLKKEISYVIDKEIEKEKKRLMDMEDSRFNNIKQSILQLIPSSYFQYNLR